MIVLRLFSVGVLLILSMACMHREPMQCPPPGAVQTISDCYYFLRIADYDSGTGDVEAVVPEQVVLENEEASGGWGLGGGFLTDFFRRLVGGGKEKYAFFVYHFNVRDHAAIKITKDALLDFHGVKNERQLRHGPPANLKAENPCLAPGQTANQQCYYRLMVTNIEPATGLVTGIVPSSVIEDNAKLFPHIAARAYDDKPYTFRVRDMKAVVKDAENDFVSVKDTNYLERCVKPNCEEHFPR